VLQTSVQEAVQVSRGKVQQKYHGADQLAWQEADRVTEYEKQSDDCQNMQHQIMVTGR
jgi:hypothetical protein